MVWLKVGQSMRRIPGIILSIPTRRVVSAPVLFSSFQNCCRTLVFNPVIMTSNLCSGLFISFLRSTFVYKCQPKIIKNHKFCCRGLRIMTDINTHSLYCTVPLCKALHFRYVCPNTQPRDQSYYAWTSVIQALENFSGSRTRHRPHLTDSKTIND